MSDEAMTTSPDQEPVPIIDGVEETTVDGEPRVFLWHAGKRYELSPPELEDFDKYRTRLASRREIDPISTIVPQLDKLAEKPPAVQAILKKELCDRAYNELRLRPEDRVPSREMVALWVDSADAGISYSAYIMLSKKQPAITEEEAAAIFKAVGNAEFLKQRLRLSKKLAEQARRLREQGGD